MGRIYSISAISPSPYCLRGGWGRVKKSYIGIYSFTRGYILKLDNKGLFPKKM
jgi:hypothetical protein